MVNLQQKPAVMIERRNSVFVSDVVTDPSQLKSEMMIQQRKFDRLEYKEKRLQVRNADNGLLPFPTNRIVYTRLKCEQMQ